MRSTPLVGRKLWFGPRRFGWGWDPVSWEGWAAMAAWVALMLAAGLLPDGWEVGGAIAAALGLVVTCILKGTNPGGPEASERLAVRRRNERRTPEMTEAARQRRRVLEDEPSVTDAARRLRGVAPGRRRR